MLLGYKRCSRLDMGCSKQEKSYSMEQKQAMSRQGRRTGGLPSFAFTLQCWESPVDCGNQSPRSRFRQDGEPMTKRISCPTECRRDQRAVQGAGCRHVLSCSCSKHIVPCNRVPGGPFINLKAFPRRCEGPDVHYLLQRQI